MPEASVPPTPPTHNHAAPFQCPVCGKARHRAERANADAIRPALLQMIQKTHPEWKPEQGICLKCLNSMRAEFVQNVLEEEKGEITQLEQEVVDSLKNEEVLATNTAAEFDKNETFGERIADKMAEFGGSWAFLLSFAGILFVWIGINSVVLLLKPFDPYPYILLNLVLSCLASIQAPVIMMSQNRQEIKDRMRAEHDYQVNLKAEIEIRHLHTKLDQLLNHQWQHLLEIQQIQTELMQEIARTTKK